YNQITDIRFLEKLTRLSSLDLRSNQISDIRPLSKLDKLKKIVLNDNRITDLSSIWEFLIHQGLTVAWKDSYDTKNSEINLKNNPFTTPPVEVVQEGQEAVVNYFRQLEEQDGTEPLYEAKLLIVGEPGAGKTTLLKKLENPDYVVPEGGDKTLKSTVGINILEGWTFPYLQDDRISFKANIWDFGGQEIQYMTHHFFLTPRALYVLVADDRKQNTEFDYWFRIINLLGRESDHEKISVLVVLNEINHQSVTNFNVSDYRRDYPGMDIWVCEVDFSKNDFRSASLRTTIQEMLCTLPHVGDPLPRLWRSIRDDLFTCRNEKAHITFEDFAAVCGEVRNGKRLTREEDQRYLSRYLHRLGVMLHYQDDDSLANFVILRPQWAVDAVYSVLQDAKVEKNQGHFSAEDLKAIWKNYTPDERSRLLSLMKKDKFEICYPSPKGDDHYIAPQLLPSARPDYLWDNAQAMKFRYLYPFMPKGLISRFIVRTNEDIASEGSLVWKEGVVLASSNKDCRAQIIQRKTIKEGLEVLDIELIGAERERKYLLRHIMQVVESIHQKSFRHISFERMVPCNCEHCADNPTPTFFEYSELLKYEDQNVPTIRCSNIIIKDVPVRELLEGVFEKEAIDSMLEQQGQRRHEGYGGINIYMPPYPEMQPRQPLELNPSPSPPQPEAPKKWYENIPWWVWSVVAFFGVLLYSQWVIGNAKVSVGLGVAAALWVFSINPSRRYMSVLWALVGIFLAINSFTLQVLLNIVSPDQSSKGHFKFEISDPSDWISAVLLLLIPVFGWLDYKSRK
ncbi:MAG: hypothetical protein HUU01_15950, partial [Saprospiraceae bacterium]|nr:hypothetical protein [Saprospiraceae bacterium]